MCSASLSICPDIVLVVAYTFFQPRPGQQTPKRVDELGIEPKTLSSRVEDANDTLYQLSYTPDDVLSLGAMKMNGQI
jgi:hypothetical protein